MLPPPLLPLLLALLPDELDPGDPESPPPDGVEDPDELLPVLVDALGLPLVPPEGADDPDPLSPEEVDAYTIDVAVEL